MFSIHYVSLMMWIFISIGNSTGNATEPWISVRMYMANERYQQNSHKWQSLDCYTVQLFHSATIF